MSNLNMAGKLQTLGLLLLVQMVTAQAMLRETSVPILAEVEDTVEDGLPKHQVPSGSTISMNTINVSLALIMATLGMNVVMRLLQSRIGPNARENMGLMFEIAGLGLFILISLLPAITLVLIFFSLKLVFDSPKPLVVGVLGVYAVYWAPNLIPTMVMCCVILSLLIIHAMFPLLVDVICFFGNLPDFMQEHQDDLSLNSLWLLNSDLPEFVINALCFIDLPREIQRAAWADLRHRIHAE